MSVVFDNACPSYLNNTDFDNWITKFGVVEYKLLDSRTVLRIGDIHVIFSDDIYRDIYGKYTIDSIKSKIKENWKTNQTIDGILREIKSYKSFLEMLGRLSEEIAEINNTDFKDIENAIRSWLRNKRCVSLRLGEYNTINKNITLFVKSIEHVSTIRNRKETFEEIFIHELFHLIHYYICEENCSTKPNELMKRWDYTSSVVKESLASYFEYSYCKDYGLVFIGHDSWYENPVYSYPYAGASEFSYLVSFKGIFNSSLDDMDGALRELLRYKVDDFYDIKNKELFEKIVSKDNIKNRTKYAFDGNIYGKSRLVLAVVKKLVDDLQSRNPDFTISDLETIMDPTLLNHFGIYKEKNKIKAKDLGIGGIRRYFIDEPIVLPDGTEILVCREWGIDNIEIILEWAKENGYTITKV